MVLLRWPGFYEKPWCPRCVCVLPKHIKNSSVHGHVCTNVFFFFYNHVLRTFEERMCKQVCVHTCHCLEEGEKQIVSKCVFREGGAGRAVHTRLTASYKNGLVAPKAGGGGVCVCVSE